MALTISTELQLKLSCGKFDIFSNLTNGEDGLVRFLEASYVSERCQRRLNSPAFVCCLQPENLMLLDRESSQIKIIDFGLSRRFSPDTECREMLGTAEFVGGCLVQNYPPGGSTRQPLYRLSAADGLHSVSHGQLGRWSHVVVAYVFNDVSELVFGIWL